MLRRKTFSAQQWRVLVLLFVIAVINYFDRQSLSVVAPRMQADLNMNDLVYAHIISLFLFASAVAYGLSGILSDWLGTRLSMTIFVSTWSLAEAATSLARSAWTLGIARFFLGMGEPGLWVAAPKAVSEQFEKRDHSLAIGIYTMGATVGAVIALPAIALVTTRLPWRSIFILDGLVGLAWVPLWLFVYRRKNDSKDSLPGPKFSLSILKQSAIWKFLLARSLTDPVWYFLLFWFPKFLQTSRNLSLPVVARFGWLVYLGAGVGTIFGGILARRLVRRGVTMQGAYRYIMMGVAIIMPWVALINIFSKVYLVVFIAAVIATAHMTWLVTLTASIANLYPSGHVGRISGFVAMGSGLGGMISSEIVGRIVIQNGYSPLFYLMGFLHPLAFLLLQSVYGERTTNS